MKIKIFIITIILQISIFGSNALADNQDDCMSYTGKDNYEIYKQRAKCICDSYKSNTNIVKLDENYPKLISEEEMDELLAPSKEQLDALNESIGSYGGMTGGFKLYEDIESGKITKSKVNKILSDIKKRNKIKEDIIKIKTLNAVTYSLPETQSIHIENMNTIYKCGLLGTQKKSLLLIKNDLIKKSPSVGKKIEGKISSKITQIDRLNEQFECSKSKSKDSIQKIILLKQATYQTCKYISYLEYLKQYNKNINNSLDPTKTKYIPGNIIENENRIISELDDEIEHIYRIFPLTFHAYTEYENNITAHFLLELLRDDYIILREKLHKALNPVNQVVYKIINAMKK